jgi:hypothetical protein
MGVCREFGPQIHPDCEHPMRAGADSCTCSHCGTRCTGRFPACPQVWERGSVAVAVRPAEPELATGAAVAAEVGAEDDIWADAQIDGPKTEDAAPPATPTYVPPLTNRKAPWARRQFPSKKVASGALALLGALLVVAAISIGNRESPDTLQVLDQQPSTTETPTTTAAASPPPAPTTVVEPPTTSPPPPPMAAPASSPPQSQPARATTARARQPARAATPTTVLRFPRMCGFVPGSPVDVEINGKPAGAQTADARGCVSRPPSGRR